MQVAIERFERTYILLKITEEILKSRYWPDDYLLKSKYSKNGSR